MNVLQDVQLNPYGQCICLPAQTLAPDQLLPAAQMGVACLMHLGDEAWDDLQGMVEHAPSPRHARRALLMGLQASALKVNPAKPSPRPCSQEPYPT